MFLGFVFLKLIRTQTFVMKFTKALTVCLVPDCWQLIRVGKTIINLFKDISTYLWLVVEIFIVSRLTFISKRILFHFFYCLSSSCLILLDFFVFNYWCLSGSWIVEGKFRFNFLTKEFNLCHQVEVIIELVFVLWWPGEVWLLTFEIRAHTEVIVNFSQILIIKALTILHDDLSFFVKPRLDDFLLLF